MCRESYKVTWKRFKRLIKKPKFCVKFIFLFVFLLIYYSIKNGYSELFRMSKKVTQFKIVFLIVTLLSLIILVPISKHYGREIYLFGYFLLIQITHLLIKKVSGIIRGNKKEINPWLIMWNFLVFLYVVAGYILIFAVLFEQAIRLGDGFFTFENSYKTLSEWDFLYISSMNFISMDTGYSPVGWTRFLVFVESFLSQVIILTFVFISLEKIVDKINPKA